MIRTNADVISYPVQHAATDTFQSDVLAGLSANPKSLPCKYFYDQRGSKLFDAICGLDEYYLTRCELEIIKRNAPAMASAIGPDAMLVEYGSGSSTKTRLLLAHLVPAAYVPVDISEKHLHSSARRLARLYPHVEVLPVAADFTQELELPVGQREPARRVGYFPGSTIGNFDHAQAVALLREIANTVGAGGGLLIGIDLQKDVATIESAYNDALGVTAAFNLNLLRRVNREIGANFNLRQFQHWARYDHANHRMDIRLISRYAQTVEVGPHTFHFSADEPIQTEYSHKYTTEQFNALATEAGFTLQNIWTDQQQFFAVLYLGVSPHNFRRVPR